MAACAIALHNMPEGSGHRRLLRGQPRCGPLGGSGLIMAVIIGPHNIPEGGRLPLPLLTGGSSACAPSLCSRRSPARRPYRCGSRLLRGHALAHVALALGLEVRRNSLVSWSSASFCRRRYSLALKAPGFATVLGVLVAPSY